LESGAAIQHNLAFLHSNLVSSVETRTPWSGGIKSALYCAFYMHLSSSVARNVNIPITHYVVFRIDVVLHSRSPVLIFGLLFSCFSDHAYTGLVAWSTIHFIGTFIY